ELYWPLDSEDGATDLSGNGRDGTGQGGIAIGGSSNSPFTTGGGSTEFDGNDDAITRSDYDLWADAGTIMVWLRRRNNDADHTILWGTTYWVWLANLEELWTPDDATEWPTWPGVDIAEHTGVGEWGCHVLTLDGSNAELWVNGNSIASIAYEGT